MFEAHFQTFEEPEGGRCANRAAGRFFARELARQAADRVRGPPWPISNKMNMSAPSEERLAWLTGFTGSAGMAIVLTQAARGVLSTARYTLQAAKQVDAKAWSVEPADRPLPGKLAGEASWDQRPPGI